MEDQKAPKMFTADQVLELLDSNSTAQFNAGLSSAASLLLAAAETAGEYAKLLNGLAETLLAALDDPDTVEEEDEDDD
jgi:hypothetical protein